MLEYAAIKMRANHSMSRDDRFILGVAVKAVTAEAAVALLDDNVSQQTATAVAFLNANTAVRATENTAFRSVLQGFVVFNDGAGVDAAHRLKYGSGFPENLNGTDFTPLYLARTRHRFRVFLLGARADVVAQTAAALQSRYPQHDIVGYHDGYFSTDQNEEVIGLIRSRAANLLLVAMGNPAQELWIADNLQRSGVLLAFGVGALFDFIAGRFPRAPRLIRWLRSEWLFRLMCEPGRLWKRYTVDNFKFLAYAMGDALKYRFSTH